jgi:protein gp37
MWNLWHGCHRISEGCRNCYVYTTDAEYERDAAAVKKTLNFNLPLKKKRNGEYKIAPGTLVNACLTSDFWVEESDEWRAEAFEMMRKRSDLDFFIITKRVDRFYVSLPSDWNDGYDNVAIGCSVENQRMAEQRLPVFKDLPIKHKLILCSPLLEMIDLRKHLGDWVEQVAISGESGPNARVCDYAWILDIRQQCIERNISFMFHQTGALFLKDGRLYRIKRELQHSQAKKANIDFYPK